MIRFILTALVLVIARYLNRVRIYGRVSPVSAAFSIVRLWHRVLQRLSKAIPPFSASAVLIPRCRWCSCCYSIIALPPPIFSPDLSRCCICWVYRCRCRHRWWYRCPRFQPSRTVLRTSQRTFSGSPRSSLSPDRWVHAAKNCICISCFHLSIPFIEWKEGRRTTSHRVADTAGLEPPNARVHVPFSFERSWHLMGAQNYVPEHLRFER